MGDLINISLLFLDLYSYLKRRFNKLKMAIIKVMCPSCKGGKHKIMNKKCPDCKGKGVIKKKI